MNRTLFTSFLLVTTLLVAMALTSCQPQYVSDYDYKKAEEAFNNDVYADAIELVNKQLKATPKHIDALYLRALINFDNKHYNEALSDLDKALRYYHGKPEVERSRIAAFQGVILRTDGRYAEAAHAFSKAEKYARKDDPDHVQSNMFLQAQMFYSMGDKNAADKVYKRMLKDNPDDCAAMVGLARNLYDKEQNNEALAWLNKAQAIEDEYGSVYKYKVLVLEALDQTDECIDAALKYYETEEDVAPSLIRKYLLKHYSYSAAKVQKEEKQQDEPGKWTFLLIDLYEHHGDYRKAISKYDRLLKKFGEHEELFYARSQCYDELGDYEHAIADLTRAYDLSENIYYISSRGDSYRDAGRYAEALRDYKTSLEEDPSEGYFYYAIGWTYELSGDKTKALEYYNQGIDIDQSYAYLFLSRGDLLRKDGCLEEAKSDYEKIIAIDTVPENGSCRHYALYGLGKEEEAVEWMNKVIAQDPYRSGNYYDKACLFGRLGKLEESLAALDTALQLGYRNFKHLEDDDDMDPIRDLPKYKALVDEYMFFTVHPKIEADTLDVDIPAEKPVSSDPMVSEIPLRKKTGGTYEIPCSINGLPLKFILDTGASDVTLSSVEADFMLKNEYLSSKDFRGNRKYLTASGNICDGAVICLKEVRVGEVTLKNIEASVVKNQQAPLLLGQSVLERFGTITIDNQNNKLIINY